MAAQHHEPMIRSEFLAHRAQLERDILPILARGSDHVGVEERFEHLLRLADRLLLSAEGHLLHGGLPRRVLDALEKYISRVPEAGSDFLRDVFEPALKLVLDRSDPVAYRNSIGKNFSLSKVISALALLSPAECSVPADELYQIKDPVRQEIRRAWYERNPEAHGAPLVQEPHAAQQRQAFLVAWFAAIDRHQKPIERTLLGLAIRDIEGQDAIIVRQVHSAYREHLGRFVGRSRYIEEILDGLKKRATSESGYILVHGPEGFGKTAITIKIASGLADSIEPIGPHSTDVNRHCPWVLGCLLHLGKWERHPDKFIPALTAQANVLLLRPVMRANQEQRAFDARMFSESHGIRNVSNAHSSVSASIHRVEPDSAAPSIEYSASVFELLSRLVEERGQAVLIIDALDEISPDGADLSFLPPVLPHGATVLLSTRRESPLIDRIRNAVHPREFALDGLSIDEIRKLSGVEDESWNGRLHRATRGCPLLVIRKAEEVREKKGAYAQVDPSEGDRALLRGQIDKWHLNKGASNNDPLYQALLLLSVFDAVAPLEFDLLQGYLGRLGLDLTGAQIRSTLGQVGSQIEGLDEGRIKLAVRALAEYVIDKHLSQRDLKKILEEVTSWLAEDEDLPDTIVASFLLQWTDPNQVKSPALREVTVALLSRLEKAGRASALLAVYDAWRATGKRNIPEPVRDALVKASALGSARAGFLLGSLMLDGRGIPQDLVEGERQLRTAAESGFSPAQFALGARLISGNALSKDLVQGRLWLERAASSPDSPNTAAMILLADCHLDGIFPEADAQQGERWLILAKEGGDETAVVEHANRLIGGEGLEKNKEAGIRMLRDAAQAKTLATTVGLGLVLATGEENEITEGTHILRSAVQDDVSLKSFLAWKILTKDWEVNIDEDEARTWLRQAAESAEPNAMYRLGVMLIEGDSFKQDIEQGKEWLLRAVRVQHLSAKFMYAKYLLEGTAFVKNYEKGKRILQEMAENEYPPAMRFLGNALLDAEYGFNYDRKKGIYWLEKAILAGDVDAMVMFAVWNYREFLKQGSSGSGEQFRLRAEKLLRRAHEDGDLDASISLAYMVRRKEAGLPSEVASVEELLKPAIEHGDVVALVNDALRMVLGSDGGADWTAADGIFQKIKTDQNSHALQSTEKWWHGTAQLGDPEGHLVIGWLVRHALIEDPDGRSLDWRMQRARAGGWNVPEWMSTAAVSPQA